MAKESKVDNSDFEIQFYENVLQKKGDFIEALAVLGNLYTRKGLHQKGLAMDLKLTTLRPDDPVALYNLACSYSLINDVDLALRSIKKAINCGYDDYAHMEKDEDLTNLRNDSRFSRYFQSIKKRRIP